MGKKKKIWGKIAREKILINPKRKKIFFENPREKKIALEKILKIIREKPWEELNPSVRKIETKKKTSGM